MHSWMLHVFFFPCIALEWRTCLFLKYHVRAHFFAAWGKQKWHIVIKTYIFYNWEFRTVVLTVPRDAACLEIQCVDCSCLALWHELKATSLLMRSTSEFHILTSYVGSPKENMRSWGKSSTFDSSLQCGFLLFKENKGEKK